MRYGSMTLKKGLQELVDKGCTEIKTIPLYPQFAMATTETIDVMVDELVAEHFTHVTITRTPAFYNQEDYIEVLSRSIAEQLESLDYEHLLFSYHGVPERHIRKRDVTKGNCKMDGKCCFKKGSEQHQFCYRHQCEITTTPAFVSDCLETLEEIAMEGEEIFHEVGGENFTVIPCLNNRDDWAGLLAKWINQWANLKTVLT